MRLASMFFIFTIIISCNQNNPSEPNWGIIYRHDANGKAILGDKSSLIDAARKGYPIRVGFGGRSTTDTLRSIEHIVDVELISIVNGKELFGQINSFFGQRPDLTSDTLRIDLKSENKWTNIIGTNGERSTLSRYFDPSNIEPSKRNKRGATWYVKLPNDFNKEKGLPLWD